jgi:hypothetical protein
MHCGVMKLKHEDFFLQSGGAGEGKETLLILKVKFVTGFNKNLKLHRERFSKRES